jgi:hypothetical protein
MTVAILFGLFALGLSIAVFGLVYDSGGSIYAEHGATCTCIDLDADWGAGSGFHAPRVERDPACPVHGRAA